jgi:hypothetical protein
MLMATQAYAQGFGSITGDTTGNTSVSGVAQNTGTQIQTTEPTVDTTPAATTTEVPAETGPALWWLVIPVVTGIVLYRVRRSKLRMQL